MAIAYRFAGTGIGNWRKYFMWRKIVPFRTFDGAAVVVVGLSVAGLFSAVALGPTPAAMPAVKPHMIEQARWSLASRASMKLLAAFTKHGYVLDNVRNGDDAVPRIFLAKLPPDLHELKSAKARKLVFIKSALPLVLRVNESIRADRQRLITIQKWRAGGRELRPADTIWLDDLVRRYGAEPGDMAKLLRRVDVVPVSLALAQAAEESGWGTSRFAREGNAIFGQQIFGDGRGLVPMARDPGRTHRVRAFDRLLDAARAYAQNLNTHLAYREFRARRAAMRATDAPLNSLALAATLIQYSERRGAYVETIHAIIRVNRLTRLDDARLNLGARRESGI